MNFKEDEKLRASHKVERVVRRENELAFSKNDMMRFVRYLANGRLSESQIEARFNSWTNGPNGERRYKWISA